MNYNGWWNFVLAMGYWLTETGYFGWNLMPQSGAEMSCDGIALLLLIVSTRHIAVDNRSPKPHHWVECACPECYHKRVRP